MDTFVKEVFQVLHDIPEKAHEEYKTSAFVYNELVKMNYVVKRDFAGTAVIAELDSKIPGPTLVVRADMDALEFMIDNKKTMIHACGHDANTSMVLGAAQRVSKKGIDSGKVIFLFQPAEENGTGAELVCKSGLLNDVDEMVGIHFRSVEDLKLGQATEALVHSATGSM